MNAKPNAMLSARGLRYYALALIDPLSTKAVFAVAATAFVAVVNWIGLPITWVLPMMLICLADLITGMVKARAKHEFSSERLRQVFSKWLVYICLIVATGAFNRVTPYVHQEWLRRLMPIISWITTELVSFLIMLAELVSMCENIKESRIFAKSPLLCTLIDCMAKAFTTISRRTNDTLPK